MQYPGLKLEFLSDPWQIQGKSVQQTLFLGILQDGFHAVVKQSCLSKLVSLIFHIDLNDGELLRGRLFAQQQKAYFSLFTDPSMEELFRAASQPTQRPLPVIAASEKLTAYARNCTRDNLHNLTELYLCGIRLSRLKEVAGI